MCIDHPRTLHLNGENTSRAVEQCTYLLVSIKKSAQGDFYVGNRIFTMVSKMNN